MKKTLSSEWISKCKLIIIICMGIAVMSQAQKRELRGAWVATVANIDWPSSPSLDIIQQRYEFIKILDSLQSHNFNAVVVQIRPTFDAFYFSKLEPWSKYLTGKSGNAPLPFYDPLDFMITETHLRCMEFHAWINPLRAYTGNNPHPSHHITHQQQQWFYTYGKNTLLNAGIPEARAYLYQVVDEIISNYNIDALHMDDYFYPYTIAGKQIPDTKQYSLYGAGFSSIGDWRRANIDTIVKTIHELIIRKKPNIEFGISPFGVWRNISADPRGSNTHAGQTNYDDLYADILLWMQNKWIDYCAPQLYWERGHSAADYNELISWWRQHNYGVTLYAGLQIYQLSTSSKSIWSNTDEVINEIKLSRQYDYNGQIFYSVKYLMKNTRNVAHDIHALCYATPAIPPIHRRVDPANLPTKPIIKITTMGNWKRVNINQVKPNEYYILSESDNKELQLISKSKKGEFYFMPLIGKRYYIQSVNQSQQISEPLEINL